MPKSKVVQVHLSYVCHDKNQVTITMTRRTSEVITVSRVYKTRLDGDTMCRVNWAVRRALSTYANVAVFPDISFRFERF